MFKKLLIALGLVDKPAVKISLEDLLKEEPVNKKAPAKKKPTKKVTKKKPAKKVTKKTVKKKK